MSSSASEPQATPQAAEDPASAMRRATHWLVEAKHPTKGLAPRSQFGLLATAVWILYVIAVVRTAWLGDDAFITLRAVDNFVSGHGLLSNPPERVQGFTNPLWTFILIGFHALGVSAYGSAISAGLLASAAASGFVVWRVAGDSLAGAVAALWLATSAAYVDFSTSGLENPLAHLLLAIFFAAFLAERLSPTAPRTWLLAALIALNRLDHALLVLPALGSLVFAHAPTRDAVLGLTRRPFRLAPLGPLARAVLLGGSPLLVWFAFSLVYYGFPFPNTAYAKLNTRLPASEFAIQGLAYFVENLQRDPITPLVIALSLFTAVRDFSRSALALFAGVACYLAYVIAIGGDFMAGRFFTAPFLLCVVWLSARSLPRAHTLEVMALGVVSLTLCLLFPTNFRLNEKLDCAIDENGIASERHCYADHTALLHNIGTQKLASHGRYKRGLELRKKGRHVVSSTNVGIMGFVAGPDVHIIDLMALTDPLLARIPYQGDDFRIGHFQREVPAGYQQTIASGQNQIADPCLHAYYDVLSRVVVGPLFSVERWKAIVGLNLGRYDYLMRQPCPLTATTQPAR